MKNLWTDFRFWWASKKPKNFFVDEGMIIEITRGRYKGVRFTFDDIEFIDDSISYSVSVLFSPVSTDRKSFITTVSDIMRVLLLKGMTSCK